MKNIDPIIGKHPALKSLLRNVKIVVATDVNVLITGETGTGKELIAVALQKNSRRADHVFITLNCSALPVSLMESMLFGHCKGAFSGADTDKQGIFAAADGGTLFLDEINSLTLALQTKLLRFIEFGEYLPVGSVTTRIANVRLIAATNSQIDKLISAGKFRQDLYFRLSVVTLELPPLRKRPQDVSLLIDHFMSYFAKKYAVRTPSLSKEVLQVLKHYRWPGNIRELRNLCENLTISRIRRTIKLNDLPVKFRENNNTPCSIYFELPELGLDWYELEKDLIQQALKKADGNRKAAAELLAISRDALYYRIKKYGLVLT